MFFKNFFPNFLLEKVYFLIRFHNENCKILIDSFDNIKLYSNKKIKFYSQNNIFFVFIENKIYFIKKVIFLYDK